ncbi:MAG: restriction endonuclease subunit S [Bacteroidales bacterium]|nr:restriction endonuclease subunit S [Bacteroidales bacterium]
MNKLEELIQQYCPNGVEFKELQEVFEIKNGYTPSKGNSDFWENGTIPWFRMEDIRANGRVLSDSIQHITPESVKGSGLFAANSIIVSTSATIGEHALITVDFLANQRFTCLTRKSDYTDRLNMLFFQNYMFLVDEWCKNNINISGFAGVDMPKFKKLKIPIPPIAVQQEIAYILDSFTQLEAELEAELEARRTQYEYYRNQLLNATEVSGKWLMNGVEVEWKTLGEVGEFVRGSGLQKNDFTKNGVGCIHYGQIYTFYGFSANKTKSFVSPELATKLRKAKKGDLVIATTSENIEDVCKAVVWLGNEEICISGETYIFKHTQNAKFIAHYLRTPLFLDFKKQNRTGTKVIRVHGDKLKKFQIPIPPIAEQGRITGILDKFDSLVNDISIGLPAEIDGRRKQYNYYRGKLLDFKLLTH